MQTPILDDFNRANEDPLTTSNWGSPLGAGTEWKLTSNQALPSTASFSETRWKTSYTANQECYCTLVTRAANTTSIALLLRGQSATSWDDYYRGHYQSQSAGNDIFQFYKVVSATATALGSSVDLGKTLGAGDRLWVRAYKGTLAGYLNGTRITLITDTSLSNAGYMGFYTDASSGVVVDDFGGGSVPTFYSPKVWP